MGIYYEQVCNYFLSILLPDRDGNQIILWTGPLLLWALLVKYMNSPLIKNGERQQESKPSAFTQSALLVCVFNFSLLLQWDQAVMEATRSQVTYREVNSLRTSCFLKKRSMGYNVFSCHPIISKRQLCFPQSNLFCRWVPTTALGDDAAFVKVVRLQ